jgi:hypothetical protein
MMSEIDRSLVRFAFYIYLMKRERVGFNFIIICLKIGDFDLPALGLEDSCQSNVKFVRSFLTHSFAQGVSLMCVSMAS